MSEPEPYDYHKQSRIGDDGVNLVIAHLQAQHPKWNILTVERDEDKRGIDLRAVLPDGDTMTIQVKTDTQVAKTGNVFLELMGNEEKGSKGLLYYCEAEWLAIVDPASQIVYSCPVSIVQAAFRQHWRMYPRFPSRINKCPRTGDEWQGVGLLVPIPEFIRKCYPRVTPLLQSPQLTASPVQ